MLAPKTKRPAMRSSGDLNTAHPNQSEISSDLRYLEDNSKKAPQTLTIPLTMSPFLRPSLSPTSLQFPCFPPPYSSPPFHRLVCLSPRKQSSPFPPRLEPPSPGQRGSDDGPDSNGRDHKRPYQIGGG